MSEFGFTVSVNYLEEDSWLPRLFPIGNSTKNNQKLAVLAISLLDPLIYSSLRRDADGKYFFKFHYEIIEDFNLVFISVL